MKNKFTLLTSILFLSFSMYAQNSEEKVEHKLFLQRIYHYPNGKTHRVVELYGKDIDRRIEEKAGSMAYPVYSDEIIAMNFYYGSKDTSITAINIMRDEFESKSLSENRLSPLNLTANIPWDEDPNTGGDQQTFSGAPAVAAAFNNGRRNEETQLSLGTNTLGSIPAPYGLTGDALALFLLNSERTARTGVDYGNGAVLGLPFQDGEANIDGIAQVFADTLVAYNIFSHTGPGGSSPFNRIDNDPNIGDQAHCGVTGGCHDFISRGENIAGYWTSGTTNPMIIERANYDWIYKDASSWGHRQASLLQNVSVSGGCCGFNNNFGSSDSEGFTGFGTAGSASYNPLNFGGMNRGDVVVFNMFDPRPAAASKYTPLNLDLTLPVSLLNFNGVLEPKNIVGLVWDVALEQNHKLYEIERSNDGLIFETLGSIFGSGNITTLTRYTYSDTQPKDGTNYYRLKMIGYDKSESYSKTIAIHVNSNVDFKVTPTITKGQLFISSPTNNYTISIFDAAGQLQLRNEETIENNPLQISHLKAGVYYLHLYNDFGYKVFKVVKI